ncbi:flagellar filament capping protein FliD [Aurantivibrio plasticivorans]
MIQNIVNTLGGGSGVDTLELVDQLVEIQSAPQTQRLDTKEELLNTQLSDYGILRSALGELETSLIKLSSTDSFNAKAVDFPDTNLLIPTKIESDAVAGNYQISVGNLAKSQSLSSGVFTETSDAVGTGTLTFRFGNWSDGLGDESATSVFDVNADKTGGTITIDETNNSLSGLRDAINNADIGVQASIINDGTGYRLLITGPEGANNELEIVVEEDGAATNNDASDLSRFAFNTGGSQLSQEQGGENAELTINGLAVTRESNVIDDVIEGLDFTIQNESATEVVSMTITEDKALAKQTVTEFVEAYNTFLDTVGKLTGYDDEIEDYGSLRTDPLAKNLISRLRGLIGSGIPGVEDGFTALTNVGIRTNRDGTIELNTQDFNKAFDENFDLVKTLFTPRYTSDSALIQAVNFNKNSTPGSYDVVITADANKGYLTGSALAGPPASFDSTGKDYSFEISVDGTASGTITLTADTVFTPEEMAAELQSQINNDSALIAADETVSVEWDTDHFVITSDSFGDSSTVSISVEGADLAELGIGTASTTTTGNNVAGTIDGVQGFGSGNVLLPDLDSDATGLSMIVAAGATTGTLSFSRGFGDEMNRVIDDFLKGSGLIRQRETSIRERISEVEDDRDILELRTEAYRARLQSQFIAMDQIVQSLQNTGSFLDGINDRLPFTAKK